MNDEGVAARQSQTIQDKNEIWPPWAKAVEKAPDTCWQRPLEAKVRSGRSQIIYARGGKCYHLAKSQNGLELKLLYFFVPPPGLKSGDQRHDIAGAVTT